LDYPKDDLTYCYCDGGSQDATVQILLRWLADKTRWSLIRRVYPETWEPKNRIWESVNETINFARNLKLETSCWGPLLPLKGTRVRNHVTVLNDYVPTLLNPLNGRILQETGSETRELPQWWQIKGWFRANIKTNPQTVYRPIRYIPKLFFESIRYAETHQFLFYLVEHIKKYLGREIA